MRLALDNHFSPVIAAKLRERGHDVMAAAEQGWARHSDEALLTGCQREQRALLTNDVTDFTRLAREWAADGRSHAGLVFTSNASMPRSKKMIGRYVRALDALLQANPAADAFADRIHWL